MNSNVKKNAFGIKFRICTGEWEEMEEMAWNKYVSSILTVIPVMCSFIKYSHMSESNEDFLWWNTLCDIVMMDIFL